ncbi:MAG TPA: RdgB/HAM1 family non-canonical purine NTP pyrophosphatase [Egibacteraceae bacterium]|nr:RdgB/HAM1 family non-canonical purine NTP pyrophosphatase [Egibacteraceae bacterium]
MMQVVLATRNEGKLAELRRILEGLDVDLASSAELGLPDVEETGGTFAENALLKAHAGAQASGLPCLADDSGLVVDALAGRPGVRSARYAGAHRDDEANLRLVLEQMRGVQNRAARFVCVAALATPDGRQWTEEGAVEGVLTREPRGEGGFGYDPILQPLGEDRTTAEMSAGDKDAISHRGKAFRAIRRHVAALAEESTGEALTRRARS